MPDPRAERLLDAAAELLVRWGYRRTSIDDVARAAGVGKGTVYLHFRTKEALFVTVLLRAQRSVLGDLADRMRTDPAQVLPGRMMAGVYRRIAEDPTVQRAYLGDPETFGALAHEAASTLGELGRRRDAVVREHLERLREAGVLRTDLDLAAQHYLLVAATTGFYLLGPDSTPTVPADSAVRAEVLGHTITSALETGVLPSRDLAEAIAARYQSLITYIDAEWRHRAR